MVAVHYKGATPAMQDVIAGHIQMMFISVGSALPQAKAGAVKLIAIGAPKRMALLPDVPTIAETVPGYAAVSWFALYGPAGMPSNVVAKIKRGGRIFADPGVQKTCFDPQYFESIAGSPEELRRAHPQRRPKWRKLIRDAQIKVE